MEDNVAWVNTEFNGINCSDKRLNRRFIKVAQSMMESPDSNIHQAMGNWSDSKAAFRLFDNDKLEYEEILKPHVQRIIERTERLEGNEILLAIQDSTTLNYTHHKKKIGINKLFRTPGFTTDVKGFHLHNTLLITEDGLPLGLLNQEVWQQIPSIVPNKRRPITEKASYRWLKGLQAVSAASINKRVITVCDRESDIYEFFVEAQRLSEYYLVRAAKDRILSTKGMTINRHIDTVEPSGIIKVDIPGNGQRVARTAILEVKYSNVQLEPVQRLPEAKNGLLPYLTVNVILAKEKEPPKGIKPLNWLLLTNHEITDFACAVRCCKWYALRWKVEEYHKVLKAGCKIEDCQLQTFERLTRYIALMSIIAFRLFWLTIVGRSAPDESCETILSSNEWKALYCRVHKTSKIPKSVPTIRDAIRMLGKLGGFLGRKNDGEPGIVVIWRGWKKLQELSNFYSLMQIGHTCG